MVISIFNYIDKLFHAIKPRKLMFMAVDGPAPRAKMNQQRARRFRSARDAREAEAKALAEGKEIPKEPAFDSNTITPGTDFMDRLTKHFKWFIRKKIAEDSAWQGIDVVFSGQEVPGEGEHKIMQYIRAMKAQPDGFDPNLTHCIYGLDADLMMLGLTTHEPNFCLLREEVLMKVSKSSRKDIFQTSQFHFLSLTLLREYLDIEFKSVLTGLPFAYDLERVVDDFVFMCFLIGNDFLPNVPTVDISEGGLDLLFATYASVMPKLNGYLTDGGCLVLEHVEAFMQALAENEVEPEFCMADLMESFVGVIDGADSDEDDNDDAKPKGPTVEQLAAINPELCKKFLEFDNDASRHEMAFPESLDSAGRKDCHFLAEAYGMESKSHGEGRARHVVVTKKASHVALPTPLGANDNNAAGVVEEEPEVDPNLWKDKYYRKRFDGRDHSDELLIRSISLSFLQGLAWVLHYYHHGCVSWGWFYPYHYAPLGSDLCNLMQFKDEFDSFELGKPFHPYEQLMAVLPPSSRKALPAAYHFLMTSGDSPIIDFYPIDFELDMNGKRNDWEAVVVIPFIDEKRLLDALTLVDQSRLSADEIKRNELGTETLYRYDHSNLESHPTTLPDFFKDIREGHSTCQEYELPTNVVGKVFVVPANAKLGPHAIGLTPTFHTLEHVFELKKIQINVFGTRPSDKPTQVALVKGVDATHPLQRPENQSESDYLDKLAADYIGQSCMLRWPHWLEARVVAVSTRFGRADAGQRTHSIRRWNSSQAKDWVKDAQTVSQILLIGKGLECGNIEVLIHATPLEGLQLIESGATKKYFSRSEMTEPVQLVIFNPWSLREPDPRYVELPPRPVEELYPVGMQVIYCKPPSALSGQGPSSDYGRPAIVIGHDGKSLVVEIEQRPAIPRFGAKVYQDSKVKYFSLYDCARKLRMPIQVLQQVLGSLFVEEKAKVRGDRSIKFNLGLKMRFSRAQEQIVGYSFAFEEQTHHGQNRVQWDLSEPALEVIKEYRSAFPEVFTYIERKGGRGGGGRDNARCTDIFSNLKPDEAFARAQEAERFLKSQPYYKSARVPIGSEALSETGIAMMDVECSMWADLLEKAQPFPTKEVRVQPSEVRRPVKELNMIDPNTPADSSFLLCDRVLNLVDNGPIAFGVEGSVIGFTGTSLTVLFDVEFASGTSFGGVVKGRKVASGLAMAGLLNLTRPSYSVVSTQKAAWQAGGSEKTPISMLSKSTDTASNSAGGKKQRDIPLASSTAGTLEPHASKPRAAKPQREDLPVPDEPPYVAFVGSLATNVSMGDINELFAPMRLKEVAAKAGFAFVTFESRADLIEALSWNGEKEHAGRRLTVRVASSKKKKQEQRAAARPSATFGKAINKQVGSNSKSGSGGEDDDDFDPANYFAKLSESGQTVSGSQPSTDAKKFAVPDYPPFTAFMGNIPNNISVPQIAAWLSNPGVTAVRLKRNNAYVDFKDKSSLQAALAKDGEAMLGCTIRLDVAEPPRAAVAEKPAPKKAAKQAPTTTKKERKWKKRDALPLEPTEPLPTEPPFVATLGNVHPATSEQDVKEWLGQPDLILSVQRVAQAVLVELCDVSALQAALGKHGHSLRGRPVAVVVAPRSSGGMQILKRSTAGLVEEEDPSILSSARPGPLGDPAVVNAQEQDPAVARATAASSSLPPPTSGSAIPAPAISLVQFDQSRKGLQKSGGPKRTTVPVCRFFAEAGHCRKGAMCPFKHE